MTALPWQISYTMYERLLNQLYFDLFHPSVYVRACVRWYVPLYIFECVCVRACLRACARVCVAGLDSDMQTFVKTVKLIGFDY